MTELPTDKAILVKIDEGLRMRIAHERAERRKDMAAADLAAGGTGLARPLPRTRLIRELLVLALDECARRRGEEIMSVEAVGELPESVTLSGVDLRGPDRSGSVIVTGHRIVADEPVISVEPERAKVGDGGGAGWVGSNVRAVGVVKKG